MRNSHEVKSKGHHDGLEVRGKRDVNNDSRVSHFNTWSAMPRELKAEELIGAFCFRHASVRCLHDIQLETSSQEQNTGWLEQNLGWLLFWKHCHINGT